MSYYLEKLVGHQLTLLVIYSKSEITRTPIDKVKIRSILNDDYSLGCMTYSDSAN